MADGTVKACIDIAFIMLTQFLMSWLAIIHVHYIDLDGVVPLLRCPKCDVLWKLVLFIINILWIQNMTIFPVAYPILPCFNWNYMAIKHVQIFL